MHKSIVVYNCWDDVYGRGIQLVTPHEQDPAYSFCRRHGATVALITPVAESKLSRLLNSGQQLLTRAHRKRAVNKQCKVFRHQHSKS